MKFEARINELVENFPDLAALVEPLLINPSPKRSASPRATSTLQSRIGLKVLDSERPIREADMCRVH